MMISRSFALFTFAGLVAIADSLSRGHNSLRGRCELSTGSAPK